MPEGQVEGAVARGAKGLAPRGSTVIGEGTFEILDGVRRSKATEMSGRTTIPAEVVGSGGKVVHLPLSALRSPKATIDASGTGLSRWLTTLRATLAGSTPPPIVVQPGGRGVPIDKVTVDY